MPLILGSMTQNLAAWAQQGACHDPVWCPVRHLALAIGPEQIAIIAEDKHAALRWQLLLNTLPLHITPTKPTRVTFWSQPEHAQALYATQV